MGSKKDSNVRKLIHKKLAEFKLKFMKWMTITSWWHSHSTLSFSVLNWSDVYVLLLSDPLSSDVLTFLVGSITGKLLHSSPHLATVHLLVGLVQIRNSLSITYPNFFGLVSKFMFFCTLSQFSLSLGCTVSPFSEKFSEILGFSDMYETHLPRLPSYFVMSN